MSEAKEDKEGGVEMINGSNLFLMLSHFAIKKIFFLENSLAFLFFNTVMIGQIGEMIHARAMNLV